MEKPLEHTMERGWRVYAPLVAICLLAAGMLAVDLVSSRAVTTHTQEMLLARFPDHRSAELLAAEVQAGQRQELLVDVGIGALTIALIVVIGTASYRARARERKLWTEHLALTEQRNRDLDAFAARAAHDLRAPLNPIRGYADLIVEGGDPPDEVRKMAGKIRVAVDRMVRVIENMLELARLGRPVPGRAPVGEVCREVLEELAADLSQAKCSTRLGTEIVALAPATLAQVLRNLIGNAVKYRSMDRPLEVRLSAEAEGDRVVLRVEDNGIGMAPESVQHAFEPFFRGRSDIAGHGLGLAIVGRIVEGAGGSCELTSEPDRGTRVAVRLPRANG
jgi:two-component system, OmpR family, sensor kinase